MPRKPYEAPKPHRIQFENNVTVAHAWGDDYTGLYTCSDCKALVLSDDFDAHRVFHDKMDELIDWAQSVSSAIQGVNNATEG